MRKMSRQFLSVLLAAVMILSHVQISAAAGNDTASGPPAAASGNEAAETRNLEMEPMDPAKLGIKKLGEETEEAGDEGDDGEISLTPDTSLNQTVRVSIFLDGKSTIEAGYDTQGIGTNRSAIAYRDALKAQQAKLTARIESVLGHTLDVKWNLTLLANAISANVKVKEIPLIERLEGVYKVERERRYEAPVMGESEAEPNTANTSANMVGAQYAWNTLGYTGAGSKIAIIDTGLDTGHQSVNNDAFLHAIEEVRASGNTVELMSSIPSGLNASNPKRVSDKIPYAYNYVDRNNTNIGHNDSAGNHGSHVAGIAAANRYIKNGSNWDDAATTVNAVGMAPDAQILVMKVFGSNGGASDSDYFAALEDAIVLGADAANLSLGSAAPGWTYDTEYQAKLNAFVNNTTNNHMVVSISAGNSDAYDDHTSHKLYAEDAYFHTGGSPGSFINSLGVAAAQNTLTEGAPLMFDGNLQVFYAEDTESSEGAAYTNPKMTTIGGTWNYVYIDALGTPEDYAAVNSAVSLSGKIVIMNRGSLTFVEKGNNLISYNPKALIVANNTDGTIHMDLTDFTGTFPYVAITLKDANAIEEGKTAQTANGVTYYTGSVQVTTTEISTFAPREEAEMTSFSSWGVPGSLIMKPEITAPGGDIYSLNGTSSASSDSNTGTTSYVSYSGTSMAAPHIAGLAAVLMQYLNEKTPANIDLMSGYNLRAIAQSLLMSTATPMVNSNDYVSILQQGAGLVEVSKAIEAKSVVMIDEQKGLLTSDTGAAGDGKVKVELGDDPERKGQYQYSFTIYNLSDQTLEFLLDTDLFTQRVDGDTLSHKTALLPAGGVTYAWNGVAPTESHDVDQDGDTDNDDAQAILDYLTGLKDEDEVDLTVADMDDDGEITSRDAYLLLDWEPEEALEGYFIAPNDKAQVTVSISLTAAQKAMLDKEGGAYLEGFTYVDCVTSTREDLAYDHEHTIPILGYFGSWTDPEMFDTNSYTENLYGNEQEPYSGSPAASTNYMRITTNGTLAKFSGNPYTVEDVFPEDRLAIRSDAEIKDIAYNLIRSAAGTGFAVSKLDEDGNVTRIITSAVNGQEVLGAWYHTNNAAWQNTATKTYNVNKALNEFNGLADGDRVRVGFYAIPEYNTMLESDDLTVTDAGLLTGTMFQNILTSGVLGKGAFVGFDFTIDDVEPQVTSAVLNGNTLSITASDDKALAYVAVLSLDGSVSYAEAAPGISTYTVSFDASDAIANAQGYVAAFVGDYAGNEAAVAVKVNDNNHVEKTVYVLTNTLEAGHDYLISEVNAAGSGHILSYTAGSYSNTVNALAVTVKSGTNDTGNMPYVESADVPTNAVWTASSGIKLMNGKNYLRHSSTTSNTINISTTNSYNSWTYNASGNTLMVDSRYMRYSSNTFSLNNSSSNKIYIYVKTTISYEIDPYSVSSVTVSPNSVELYRGDTANLTAKIAPLTASPRTVTWTSSNNSVATVNDVGVVTAVAAGTATIRATSNADNTKYGECTVTVVSINKELSAAIWDEEGAVYFSYFNTNNLPTWTKRHQNGGEIYVTNAFMPSTSSLYASTNDFSKSMIYSVNRTSYALTESGENYVPAFGMAPVGSSFGSSYFVYAFAKYLIFGNLEPETDAEMGTFCGFPYGLLDLTETSVGDAYAVAVCIRSRSTTSASYYFLDETGKIWQVSQSYSSSGISFGTPTLIYETGINAGLQYNSIYYDGTNLFWTHQEDNDAVLYILANANTSASRKFYRAGNFGEGVWPAAGLYVNGSVAPASVGGDGEIMEAGDETFDASTLKIQATRDELFTADIQARFAAEAERMAAKKVNAPAEAPAEPLPVEEPTETEPVETPAETESPEAPAEETEAPVETEAEPEETETELAETEAPAEESETDPEETEAAEEVTEAPVEETEEPSEDETFAEEPSDEDPEEEPEEATDAEAEESSEEESLDPAYTGSLNVARVVSAPREQVSDASAPKAATPSATAADGTFEVSIKEADAVNGLYALVYNPDEMEYVSVEPLDQALFYYSNNMDGDKGVITFAFASKTPIAEEDDLAIFTFNVKSSNQGITLEVQTLERNEAVELGGDDNTEVITVPGIEQGQPSNIVANSLNLDGKMEFITYIVLSEEIKADSAAYVNVTFNGETTKHMVSDLLAQQTSSGQVRVKQEAYAVMMRDEMKLQIFNGQDEVQPLTYKTTTDVTSGFIYTMKDCLVAYQTSSAVDDALKTLARVTELYGIAAQIVFNYKTEQLTDQDLADVEAAINGISVPGTCGEVVSGTLPDGITDRSKSLELRADNSMRQYFNFDDANLGRYTFKVNGVEVTPVKAGTGRYYVQKQNIGSGVLSEVNTFSVSDGTNTFTINSSALGYAYAYQENGSNQDLIRLCKLLYLYSQAADIVFG